MQLIGNVGNTASSIILYSNEDIRGSCGSLSLLYCVINEKTVTIHYTLKNFRVRFDPEKSPMGPDPFLGQTDLEAG